MKIDTYFSAGWRSSSLHALGLCLLWVFATTLPVLAQDDKAKQFIAGESLGGIKLGMTEKKLQDLLGLDRPLEDHGYSACVVNRITTTRRVPTVRTSP